MNLLSFVLRNTGIEATRHFMNRAELHVHVHVFGSTCFSLSLVSTIIFELPSFVNVKLVTDVRKLYFVPKTSV